MDHNRLRSTAHLSIVRNGRQAVLRRFGLEDRPCWASVIEYKPIERVGRAINPTDRRALVSPFTRVGAGTDGTVLTPPPGTEDLLVTLQADGTIYENLRLYAPVGRIQPGDLVLMWDLQVRLA